MSAFGDKADVLVVWSGEEVTQEDLLRIESDYWFPAKHYGWGWGFPITWQGWLIFVAYALLVVVGVLLFPPRKALIGYLIYVAVLSVALIGVCWLKGEPPRWRWDTD